MGKYTKPIVRDIGIWRTSSARVRNWYDQREYVVLRVGARKVGVLAFKDSLVWPQSTLSPPIQSVALATITLLRQQGPNEKTGVNTSGH